MSARHAILLDALGTLVELDTPALHLRAQLGERFGVELSVLEAQHAITAEMAYYRAHLNEGHDQAGLARLRRDCARVLHAALPPTAQPLVANTEELTQALLSSLRFTAFADVAPALAAARDRGQRLVVVSNWDISLHEVLERVGIATQLNGVVTSAQLGARKPAPAIFEEGLRLAGVPGDQAVHVGDSLEEDVYGASAAGIEAILLCRDGAPGPPGVRAITSLAELT